MIKSIKFLAIVMTSIFLSSYTDKNSNEFIGTYGVSGSDPSQIKLTINSDNTFYYQDFSNADNKLFIKGSWTSKGKKVFLADNSSNKRFYNVWTISENGQIAKSRKGLTFYSLCKMDE